MLKKILTTAAPLALLALATAPAQAADYGAARVATPSYGTWADLTLAAGLYRNVVDYFNDSNSKSVIRGEARVGMSLGGNAMLQLDLAGDSIGGDGGSNTTLNIAAHIGLLAGPGGGYGIMASIGSSNCGFECGRHFTIAGEGVWALGFLGPSRLGVQAGWTVETTDSDDSVGYIHGVLDFLAGPNMLLSVNLGYSSDSDDYVTWRFGAKGEMAFNSMVSGFLEWQGSHITQGPIAIDENRVLLGVTIAVNGTSLANRSPLHDFNPWTGVNHLQW